MTRPHDAITSHPAFASLLTAASRGPSLALVGAPGCDPLALARALCEVTGSRLIEEPLSERLEAAFDEALAQGAPVWLDPSARFADRWIPLAERAERLGSRLIVATWWAEPQHWFGERLGVRPLSPHQSEALLERLGDVEGRSSAKLMGRVEGVLTLWIKLYERALLLGPEALSQVIEARGLLEALDPERTYRRQVDAARQSAPRSSAALLALLAQCAAEGASFELIVEALDGERDVLEALTSMIASGWVVKAASPQRVRFRLPWPLHLALQESGPGATALWLEVTRAVAAVASRWRAAPQRFGESLYQERATFELAAERLLKAQRFDEAAQCALAVHVASMRSGPLERGREALERALPTLEEVEDEALHVELLEALCYLPYYMTEERSVQHRLSELVQLASRRGLDERAAQLGCNLARSCYYEGQFEATQRLCREALSAARQHRGRRMLCALLDASGQFEFLLGERQAAMLMLDEALQMSMTYQECAAARLLSSVAWGQKIARRHEIAATLLRRAIDLAEDDYTRGLARSALGEVLLDLGEPERAAEVIAEALPLNRSGGFSELAAQNQMILAYVAMAQRDYPSARLQLLDSMRHQDAFYRRVAELHLVACDVAQGELELAAERLERVLPALSAPSAPLPWEALSVWYAFGAAALKPLDVSRARALSQRARSWEVGLNAPHRQQLFEALATGTSMPPRPGLDWFERALVAILAEAAPSVSDAKARDEREGLIVGPQGEWFQLGREDRVDLSRRGPMRRLLAALARHAETGGGPLGVFELFERAWPGGEHVKPEHAAHRVYNTLSELRSMGLSDHLVRREEGYVLEGLLIKG